MQSYKIKDNIKSGICLYLLSASPRLRASALNSSVCAGLGQADFDSDAAFHVGPDFDIAAVRRDEAVTNRET